MTPKVSFNQLFFILNFCINSAKFHIPKLLTMYDSWFFFWIIAVLKIRFTNFFLFRAGWELKKPYFRYGLKKFWKLTKLLQNQSDIWFLRNIAFKNFWKTNIKFVCKTELNWPRWVLNWGRLILQIFSCWKNHSRYCVLFPKFRWGRITEGAVEEYSS